MTKSLRDYRPQHDEDCASFRCSDCDGTNLYHSSPRSRIGYHAFKPNPCTCGLQALLDAGAAALSVPEGWQPIEAAPKERQPVIVWSAHHQRPVIATIGTPKYNPNLSHWYSIPGHWAVIAPTHWMPLPSPPEAK